jgi:glycogen synthase
MKILLYSPAFLPMIGGLEINVANLAGQFTLAGHQVVVVTRTAGQEDAFPFRVVRRPGVGELLTWTRWCDVFFQANVSLRGLWPLLLVRRPWVVSHHSWYRRPDGRIAWQDRAKRRLLRYAAASIAVSRAVAEDLDTPALVIPNPYQDKLFQRLSGVERSGELVFVGRLVSDKGTDLLLDALARLSENGLHPRLTIVGEGPEKPLLCNQARRLGVMEQIEFLGIRTGLELVKILNRHRILVVPSRYSEPFGIVALEGIACGCVIVGSEGGGLKEAIGPCGLTFPNGQVGALARVLGDLLRHSERDAEFRSHAEEHLARHASTQVAAVYLKVLQNLVAGTHRLPAASARGRALP